MTGQPVQDGTRSPRERQYDDELARADHKAAYADRDTCAAVEHLARTLARSEEVSHGLFPSSEVMGPRSARAADDHYPKGTQ